MAVPTVGAFEVVLRSHAVFDTVFGFECRGAGFALVFWSPMVEEHSCVDSLNVGSKRSCRKFRIQANGCDCSCVVRGHSQCRIRRCRSRTPTWLQLQVEGFDQRIALLSLIQSDEFQ